MSARRGPVDRDGQDSDLRILHVPASVPAIVIHRQEVSPMNAVSAVGAPLQSTVTRLR